MMIKLFPVTKTQFYNFPYFNFFSVYVSKLIALDYKIKIVWRLNFTELQTSTYKTIGILMNFDIHSVDSNIMNLRLQEASFLILLNIQLSKFLESFNILHE